MTWIDLLLVLLFAAFVSLGAERRMSGLLLGLGGILLLRPLLLLGSISPVLAVAAALLAGLAIALAARRLARLRPLPQGLYSVLGGVGGGLLGAALVASALVSLPVGRNAADQIIYPSQELPPLLAAGVRGSRLFREGRDILLYPLLERQGDLDPARRPALRALHSFLVVGEPWDRR